jgi:hypothetical protein
MKDSYFSLAPFNPFSPQKIKSKNPKIMERITPVSPFLEHMTNPQKTPHTPIISAKMESLIIQFNALVKVMRTKKFRALRSLNHEAWCERLDIYTDQQQNLIEQIDSLGRSAGGTIHIWDGAV